MKEIVVVCGAGLVSIEGLTPDYTKDPGRTATYPLFIPEEQRMIDLDILKSLGPISYSTEATSSYNILMPRIERARCSFVGSELLRLVGVAWDEEPEPDS
jgi:hypothetical protein